MRALTVTFIRWGNNETKRNKKITRTEQPTNDTKYKQKLNTKNKKYELAKNRYTYLLFVKRLLFLEAEKTKALKKVYLPRTPGYSYLIVYCMGLVPARGRGAEGTASQRSLPEPRAFVLLQADSRCVGQEAHPDPLQQAPSEKQSTQHI